MKAKIAHNNSQVSDWRNYSQSRVKIPSMNWLFEKWTRFVASVTCGRYQIAFKWSVNFWLQFLVNDEMENISMDEISI